MQRIKDIFSNNRRLLYGILLHIALIWLALILSYNSYKDLMQRIEPLTRVVRDSITATFHWVILIFSGLYLILFIGEKRDSIFLAIWRYVFLIFIYGILLNLIFFSKGRDVFIPLNLSIFYFIILLTLCFGISKAAILEAKDLVNLQDWLPPIAYRFLMNNLPNVKSYIKKKPSALFIIAFMALLIICAFLLVFKAEKAAEELANIAFFSLVIGVGIEVYQLIKYGEKGGKE